MKLTVKRKGSVVSGTFENFPKRWTKISGVDFPLAEADGFKVCSVNCTKFRSDILFLSGDRESENGTFERDFGNKKTAEAIKTKIKQCFVIMQKASETPKNLAEIIELHQKWLSGEKDGRRADLRGANLQRADLQRANLQDANLQRANLQRANLQDANLRGANLQRANLQRADLQRANLQRANLQRANLQDADLQDADLQRANLQDADLQRADLQRANLQDADLRDADLQRADLQRANLQDANLRGADLDFSCLPLWCGSLKMTVDRKIAAQIAYHFCALRCAEPEVIELQKSLYEFANTFHRVGEVAKFGEQS
jgi:Uncharacterized low-complexity proteins